MKKEIHLTAVEVTTQENIQALLDSFEEKTDIHVVMNMIGWETYRSEFVQMALHKIPGDVAMVGTPITSDLIGMNALRPFSTSEIHSMGGSASFLPSRWQSGIRPGSPEVWAIPWVLDIRMIYYWKDMLAKAGLDEKNAFIDADHIEATLQKLQAMDRKVTPLSVPNDRYTLLHVVSSFIWAEGSDLLTPDGKRVLFHEEAGLRGLRRYFSLLRYVNPALSPATDRTPFDRREVAVLAGNGWAAFSAHSENVGTAALPGRSYVGGTDLMIWQHSRNESAALELIRYLTHPETVLHISQFSPLLPMRVQQLNELAADPDGVRSSVGKAALTGHTYPCVPMIGLIEDRLSVALLSIQQELFKNPTADLDALLRSRIVPLGNRTNISLGA